MGKRKCPRYRHNRNAGMHCTGRDNRSYKRSPSLADLRPGGHGTIGRGSSAGPDVMQSQRRSDWRFPWSVTRNRVALPWAVEVGNGSPHRCLDRATIAPTEHGRHDGQEKWHDSRSEDDDQSVHRTLLCSLCGTAQASAKSGIRATLARPRIVRLI
jgi:hypothetical protein